MVPPHLLPVPLGQVVATPAAFDILTQPDILAALRRHSSGDWGEVDADDKAANDAALQDGTRLLSAYESADGVKFWIITEADRSSTTVLLPEDY